LILLVTSTVTTKGGKRRGKGVGASKTSNLAKQLALSWGKGKGRGRESPEKDVKVEGGGGASIKGVCTSAVVLLTERKRS